MSEIVTLSTAAIRDRLRELPQTEIDIRYLLALVDRLTNRIAELEAVHTRHAQTEQIAG